MNYHHGTAGENRMVPLQTWDQEQPIFVRKRVRYNLTKKSP